MTIYSHSRLSTFEQCRLKFKYKYIDKIDPLIPDTIETFLGSRVHEVLEKLYKDLKFEKKPTKEELLNFLEEIWKENYSDEIKIVREGYTAENYFDMAKKFVGDYFDTYSPFDQTKVIGTEIYIVIKLDKEGKYQIQGYIDRLDEKNGVYEIHDYKTSKDLPIQEYLDKDRQLALYAIGVKENYKDAKDVRLIWHYLSFDKELESHRTDKQLESLKQEVIDLIKEIEACKEFPAKTSALCDWCEFKPICPEWRHLFNTEEKSDDGTELVNQFSELKEQESDIKKKLELLRDKILAFAEKEKVDAVFGDDKRAKIWSKELDKFPKSTDYNYGEFVDLVKKLGIWNEFSRVDSFKLEKAFENSEFHGELMEALRKYAKKEKVSRIYLGKK